MVLKQDAWSQFYKNCSFICNNRRRITNVLAQVLLLCNDLMAFYVTGEPLESTNSYKLRRRNSETLRAQYINTKELKYVCFNLTILLYNYDLILYNYDLIL